MCSSSLCRRQPRESPSLRPYNRSCNILEVTLETSLNYSAAGVLLFSVPTLIEDWRFSMKSLTSHHDYNEDISIPCKSSLQCCTIKCIWIWPASHSPCSFIAVDLPVDGLHKAWIFHWKDKAFLAKVQCFLMKFQNELGWPGISRLSMLEISPVSISKSG